MRPILSHISPFRSHISDPKFYEEVRDLPKLTSVLNDILDNYNVTFPTQMNLVFFVDALSHAVRISRILRQPRGEAVTVLILFVILTGVVCDDIVCISPYCTTV